MITYGYSLQGKNHITRGLPCQDSNKIAELRNGWFVAAIADGVGSAERSQEGAQTAVDTVVDFCRRYMPLDSDETNIISMLRTAFHAAMIAIYEIAEKENHSIESYDTTLSVVIFNGIQLVYGHSGDGGIIVLDTWGNIVSITDQQKGSDGISVIPLDSVK